MSTKTKSVILNGWEQKPLKKIASLLKDGTHGTHKHNENGVALLSAKDISNGVIKIDNDPRLISHDDFNKIHRNYCIKNGDILLTLVGSIGNIAKVSNYNKNFTLQRSVGILRFESGLNDFLYQLFQTAWFKNQLKKRENRGAQGGVYLGELGKIEVLLPPEDERRRIVRVLETWDRAIALVERKIACKRAVKQWLMQQLLTGQRRLPGFSGEWNFFELKDIANCLDNKREPLNSEERRNKKGSIPYCGANGIVDYVDDFTFDQEIILIAEDGGFFDEYKSRPIAYRMNGKTWVNNHAHVLVAKKNVNQNLLFFATVHKNILRYLNGGTRSKLNKSELLKIEYFLPVDRLEQDVIASVFNNADLEINLLQQKLDLLKDQKKYLLNNLVTGAIRTPEDI